MSFTALRQAALASRRTYTVGSQLSAEPKRTDSGQDSRLSDRRPDSSIQLEPHWQASIESATD